MARKIQVPSVGGLRKVIAGTSASTATTIQGLEGQSLSLAQLATLLGTTASAAAPSSGTSSSTTGGSGSTGGASLVVGPGLAGGGPLLGAVNLRLSAPMPWRRRGEDGRRGRPGPPGQSGTGGGGGGSLTVTDGTHAVAGVTQLTFSGAVVSGSSPNATATISGGGGTVVNNFIMRRRQAEIVRGRRGPPGVNGTSGGGGSSWSITDGTHSVSNVTSLTVSGATVGGSGGAATLSISGGGATFYPATILDFVHGFDASQIFATAGNELPSLQNSCPYFPTVMYTNSTPANTGTLSTTQLNGKNVLAVNGNSEYVMGGTGSSGWPVGPTLYRGTFFAVFNSSNVSNQQSLYCGGANSLQIYVASGVLGLSCAFIAAIGSDTTALANNTWYQVNATYDSSTGNYAFRVSRLAGASGSNAQNINSPTYGIAYTPTYGQGFQGEIAELLAYNRVLTNTEIMGIESYLNTKWGV